MIDYTFAYKNIQIPFQANDDKEAIETAKNFVRYGDYDGMVIQNHDTSVVFDMNGKAIKAFQRW